MRRRLGDRRGKPRFDIVGDLWGSLEVLLPLHLKNVGPGGALFEADSALLPDSVHRLQVSFDGREFGAELKVRHVREVSHQDGRRTFLIGVEFLTMNPLLISQLAELSAAAGETATEA